MEARRWQDRAERREAVGSSAQGGEEQYRKTGARQHCMAKRQAINRAEWGGRRRRGQIAQHRAQAKQGGSDVTAEQGGRLEERASSSRRRTRRQGRAERRDGGGTGRAERRHTQMPMARAMAGADKAGNIMAGQGRRGRVVQCSKIELYYSRHHDTPNGLRK